MKAFIVMIVTIFSLSQSSAQSDYSYSGFDYDSLPKKLMILPAVDIPAKYIPAKQTSWGYLPAVTLPAVHIPESQIWVVDWEAYNAGGAGTKKYQYASNSSINNSWFAYSPLKLTAAQRESRFRTYNGNFSQAIALYEKADLDKSSDLSLVELQNFQNDLWKNFEYKNNTYAMTPTAFISRGGGDCEDWALMTAGLLDYWGWECYIASFGTGNPNDVGHAVCLARPPMPIPADYFIWTVDSLYKSTDGAVLSIGKYITIDYYVVGGLTNAVEPDWIYEECYTPWEIYNDRF